MSDRGYSIKDQYAIHFITFSVVQWIDVFSRTEYADIVLESLKFCQTNKGLKVHAWCIMSNHIYLIISTIEPNRCSERF
jgi:REP element-mobilizing transposase RayT